MAIGAALWGLANQVAEFGWQITKPGLIGCQFNYVNLQWMPAARYSQKRARPAYACKIGTTSYTSTCSDGAFMTRRLALFREQPRLITAYEPLSHRNASNITYAPNNWLNAAMRALARRATAVVRSGDLRRCGGRARSVGPRRRT